MKAHRSERQRRAFSANIQKANQQHAERHAASEATYLVSPSSCQRPGCGKTLPYLKRKNKYCSKSCAALVNNAKRPEESRASQKSTIRKKFRGCDGSQAGVNYTLYKRDCSFNFFDLRKVQGSELIDQLGWYDPIVNKTGCARDHQFTISEGFRLGIDPWLISHPANCRIITQRENAIKHTKSSITLEELIARIYCWI